VFTYKIQANQPDSHQSQPWCLILVVRFKNQNTFEGTNPSNAFLPITQQPSVDPSEAVAYDKVLIRSDVLSCTVTSTKNSFTGTATATLVPGQLDYQYVVFPGDHAFVWIHNDVQHLSRVVNLVRNGSPANDWMSGLKFYGRVESCRKIFTTSERGIKTMRYQLNMKSFQEFNSQIYFNPYMKLSTDSSPFNFFAEVTANYQSLFSPDGQITPTSMITSLVSIFLGNGPGANATGSGAVQRSSNNAYVIPKAVGEVFGQTSSSNGALLTYADVLNTLVGVQSFPDVNNQLTSANQSYSGFVPLLDSSTVSSRQRTCATKLLGRYLALPDLFNNTTLWSLLQTYLNTTVNEMYMTLRTDENGNILPTVVARQIPFSTKKISVKQVPYTLFSTLPAWDVANNVRINTYNIGTSDVMRVNFVQFYGQVFNSGIDAPTRIAEQSGPENFKEDRLDVLRNGGRNIITTSNTIVNTDANVSAIETADNYSSLLADWYINGHLKLTGSMQLAGVAEPICVGDNLRYDNKLYHIETVTHTYQMQGPNKSFTTSLDLTNGMTDTGDFIVPLPLSAATVQSTTTEQYNTTTETNGSVDESVQVNDPTQTNLTDMVKSVVVGTDTLPAVGQQIAEENS
jgi:hypothetical protein